MKAENYIYFVITLFSILSCENSITNRKNILNHKNFNVVEIDPQKDISLKTSGFIDMVQFIPLETTRESEFSEITQITSVDDRYIILDKNTSQILFFSKTGDFLTKISPDNDQLPTPYKHIAYFTIDKIHEKIHFNDLHSPHKYEFDLDGNFLEMYSKERIDYSVRESHYLNGNQLSYFAYKGYPKDKEYSHNVFVFKDNMIKQTYLPFDASIINRSDVYGATNYFFESDDLLFFTMPYDEIVYCFDNSTLEMFKAYQFKLPDELSLPSNFRTGSKYSKKRKKFIKNNATKIYLITDFFKTGNNLIFKLVGGKYLNQFLYNLSNKSLVSLTRYTSDSTTHFLPILGNRILGMDKDRVLSSFSSKTFIDMINNRSKYGDNIQSLPKDIKDIYDRGNNQNPVLMLTTFKKEIPYNEEH